MPYVVQQSSLSMECARPGGAYESYELIDGVGSLAGLSRGDAAAYIVDGFTAKVRGVAQVSNLLGVPMNSGHPYD